jgi:hypothetical protein
MNIEYPVDENECVTYDDLIAAHEAFLRAALAEQDAELEYLEGEL